MLDTYLGSRDPWGGRVLCKVKTHFQDTYDHAVAHSYHDWLIWHRLCVTCFGGSLVDARFFHSWVAGSISRRLWYVLLMRPNKVEIAVPYVGGCWIFRSW